MANPLTVGKFEVQNTSGKPVMRIDPEIPAAKLEILNFDKVVATLGSEIRATAALRVVTGKSTSVHYLHGSGLASFGSHGSNGKLQILGSDGKHRIHLDADAGEVALFPASAQKTDSSKTASIQLGANQARIRAGGGGLNGDLVLFDFKADSPDTDGGIIPSRINLSAGDATITVGSNGKSGNLHVLNEFGKTVVNIDGKTGDIILANADCAEEFDMEDPAIEPGSVLVIGDNPGRLRLSDTPYDTRVAGILSGAGDYRPAITLDRKPGRNGRRPVALVGKVWCKVEAESAPISVGTMLTTSSLPGHAMAASDRERAFGAVIGKALAPLVAGVGVVPVLVALQ